MVTGRRMGDNLRGAAQGTQQTFPVGGFEQPASLVPCAVPKNGEQPVPCTQGCPHAWDGGCGRGQPAQVSLHSLGTWQHLFSLSASIPEYLSRTMEQLGEIPPSTPNSPTKEPSAWLGMSPHCAPASLEMDSMGFREKRQCGQGHRENRPCRRSTRSHPAQVPISLSLGWVP